MKLQTAVRELREKKVLSMRGERDLEKIATARREVKSAEPI
jgi:hypothetical protein